jgi:L-alanine-DL-glutamate epimerase-like enolase superfamily enzyme
MTKLVAIEAATARVPLDEPAAFATRSVTERFYTLVRVRADDGSEGVGFAYGGNRAGELTTMAVTELLGPILLGQDPYRTEGLWEAMYQESLLQGRAGSVMRALSALDIALWDRNARAAGLPLWQYLGADSKETVAAYASGGYYRQGKTAEDLAAEMASYTSAGFRAVKMKVGRLDGARDGERVKAARQAIGPDVHLMLDANNAWSDVTDALRALEEYAPYDPYWIEEPFGPEEIESHAQLAARTHIPVATGEIEAGRWRHRDLLVRGAAAILQTDAAVCGGISEWRRIAATAASFGVTMCPHWFDDLHVHLVAATSNAHYVELFPDERVFNFRLLHDRRVEVRQGELVPPLEPGLGFWFDPEALRAFAPRGWQAVG